MIFTFALVLISIGTIAADANPPTGSTVSVKSARLTISGTSTMHDYALVTTTLNVVSTAADAGSLLDAGALQSFALQIPVNSFTTDKDGLKKKMLETIKGDKHPFITFELDDYAAAAGVVRAKGTLTVAGVAQPVDLELQVTETADGVQVKGTRALSMKAFGIKAPTMFMGMLKTNDQVTITFELQLTRAIRASN
jgi:polyisoprenoid-binding protein YceI